MTLRSKNRQTYRIRILFVVLICLAVHCALIAFGGGDGAFAFWRPERMRAFVVIGIIVGVALYELRPKETEEDVEGMVEAQPESADSPAEEKSVPAETQNQPAAPSVLPAEQQMQSAERAQQPTESNLTETEVAQPTANPSEAESRTEAERLWKAAREMPHNYIPNLDEDHEYLQLVYDAAMAGGAAAQAKLGEYAFRREALVEAYYWTKMAESNGAEDVQQVLADCCAQWLEGGGDPEYENVYDFFTEQQGVLGRAELRLDTGMDAELALADLHGLCESGDQEAAYILAQYTEPPTAEDDSHDARL